MLLAIWAATGCIAPATDIGAGEKERQTLEPLLTTNVSRTSLLLGKYIAVVISGILATFASLIGFGLAAMINPSMFATISLSLGALLTIGFAAVGLTMAFAALELAISFYARNFKEAQTYLTPITFVVLIPAYFTMYLDGKLIPSIYFHIPIINTISIIKEVLVGIFDPMHLSIVFVWTGIYVALAIGFVLSLFKKETVIFRN
jgi:sodium transport system permease protein